METTALTNEQSPIERDEIFKLNFDYLVNNHTFKQLQTIAKTLGEVNVGNYTNDITKKVKSFNKGSLSHTIMKNNKYTFKTHLEIKKINETIENEKKIEYIKELKSRLYKNTKTCPNSNYINPCLIYDGKDTISIKRQTYTKYRVSYALNNDIVCEDIEKVNDKGEILHICHGHNCHKNCIESTHLSLKTILENMYDDKLRDGTLKSGENHYKSKISEELAVKIKHSKGDGRTREQRAKDFNVSLYIVSAIDSNSSWNHLPDKNGVIFDTSEKRRKERE